MHPSGSEVAYRIYHGQCSEELFLVPVIPLVLQENVGGGDHLTLVPAVARPLRSVGRPLTRWTDDLVKIVGIRWMRQWTSSG
ncbi:unnamed protein product [Leptidea sinapis]|uniref:Uncharacterized protein n=1 Tax=Leptidea sinapis TaxID=189913 RepID=A0A5E4Q3F4_9NEOP|nr:unnamed protein product [Leptidea sinapis]